MHTPLDQRLDELFCFVLCRSSCFVVVLRVELYARCCPNQSKFIVDVAAAALHVVVASKMCCLTIALRVSMLLFILRFMVVPGVSVLL